MEMDHVDCDSCDKLERKRGSNCAAGWRSWRCQSSKNVQISATMLLGYTALVYAGFCAINGSRPQNLGAVSPLAAVLEAPVECNDPEQPQRNEHHYQQYVSKLERVKIRLLSERDGAPLLRSEQSRQGSREITIVTQMSMDRMPQLEKMASSWSGAICVAVHVKTLADIGAAHKRMKSFHEYIEAQRNCRLYVQMVMEEGFKSENDVAGLYPVNTLRNVALSMATTDLVFILDVDFAPNPGLHEKLTANERVYADLLSRAKHEGQLLVVPAFQDREPEVNLPMPRSMEELRERWGNGTVESFHEYNGFAHGPTGYGYFMHPLTKHPYHIQYRESYEPYVIAARDVIPKFDERFRGYGKNKIAHLYNCAVLGFSFVVLPEVYVFETPHPKTKFLYTFFREKHLHDPCQRNIMHLVFEVFRRELNEASVLRTQIETTQL